jgi:hypothetical protein
MRPRVKVYYLCMMLCTTVCNTAAPDRIAEQRYVEHDSAGIVIVENLADSVDLTVLRVDSVPLLRLGLTSGTAAEEFGSIAGVARLSSGGIAVADNSALEVRYFTADGDHIRTVGGEGEAPGEYRQIGALGRFAGDSIFVWDAFERRATILSSSGETVRVVSLAAPPGEFRNGVTYPQPALRPVHPALGGEWRSLAVPPRVPPEDLELPAMHVHPVVVLRHDARGSVVDTVASGVGYAALYLPAPVRDLGDGAVTGGHRVVIPSTGIRTVASFSDERVYLGAAPTFEIGVHDVTGRLLRVARYPRLEREYTAAEFEDMRRATLAAAESEAERAASEALFDPDNKPDLHRSFDRLLPGDAGDLWVRLLPGGARVERRWIVLGADGVARALVEIPAGLTVYDVRDGTVVGVERDSMDVQFVTVRRIREDGRQ